MSFKPLFGNQLFVIAIPPRPAYNCLMNTRTLGKTGLQVSTLGFGSAPAAYLKSDPDAAAQMINFMLDHGVNLIDTAASYPGSENFLGEHLSHRRNDFVLVSKCGQKLPGLTGEAWSYDLVTQTVDLALRNLKTDRIDVMLLHSCDLETLKKGDALRALIDAKKAGKIAHAGYSGDNDALEYAATLPDIEVCETSISIADQHNINHGLAVCLKQNVGVIVKRPIANAAWRNIDQQPGFYKNYAKDYTDRIAKMNLTPADLGFQGQANERWPEIALRFTLAQPGVTCAIIGTTKEANAKANLDYAKKDPLPADVVKKIRDAFNNAQGDEKWMGLT